MLFQLQLSPIMNPMPPDVCRRCGCSIDDGGAGCSSGESSIDDGGDSSSDDGGVDSVEYGDGGEENDRGDVMVVVVVAVEVLVMAVIKSVMALVVGMLVEISTILEEVVLVLVMAVGAVSGGDSGSNEHVIMLEEQQ